MCASAACTVVGLDCGQVACDGALHVHLEGTPDDSFTVTARSDLSEPRVIECGPAEHCSLSFPDYAPASVTITYESGDRVVEQSFSPDYQLSQPNGEECGPTCVYATVVLELE